MAESSTSSAVSVDSVSRDNNRLWKGAFAVAGIMVTLVTYGLLQVSFLFYFIDLLASLFMCVITVLGSLSLSLFYSFLQSRYCSCCRNLDSVRQCGKHLKKKSLFLGRIKLNNSNCLALFNESSLYL